MTYSELQSLAQELAEIWGYSETQTPPHWPHLVNFAYNEIVWHTESRKERFTFPSAANTAIYVLNSGILTPAYTQDVKRVIDVYYGNGLLRPVDEGVLRRDVPLYHLTPAGLPTAWYVVGPNRIRLYPTPATSNVVVTIYCVVCPPLLVQANDVPTYIPEVHHQAIAVRAAYLHARKYAKGEALTQLTLLDTEYQEHVRAIRQLLESEYGNLMNYRAHIPIASERVQI